MENNIKEVIKTRLNTLIALNETKQKDLAAVLGVKDNVISYFCSGARTPNIEQLNLLSDYFNVSLDYLVGRSDIKTPNADIRAVCEYTGLSEKAIDTLHMIKCHNVIKNNDRYMYLYGSYIYSDFIESINHQLIRNSLYNYHISFSETENKLNEILEIDAFHDEDEYIKTFDKLKAASFQKRICKVSYIEMLEEVQRAFKFAIGYDETLNSLENLAVEKMAELKTKDGEPNGDD